MNNSLPESIFTSTLPTAVPRSASPRFALPPPMLPMPVTPVVTMKSLPILTKVDLCILPLMLAASFLAHLDKVLSTPVCLLLTLLTTTLCTQNSLAYAAALGMTNDVHLHGS